MVPVGGCGECGGLKPSLWGFAEEGFDLGGGFCEAHALHGDTLGEGAEQSGGGLAVQQDEDASVGGGSDEAAEGLAQAEADDAVVVGHRVAAGEMGAAFAVQDVWPRPGHAFEDHQSECAAGDIYAVAHGVGA